MSCSLSPAAYRSPDSTACGPSFSTNFLCVGSSSCDQFLCVAGFVLFSLSLSQLWIFYVFLVFSVPFVSESHLRCVLLPYLVFLALDKPVCQSFIDFSLCSSIVVVIFYVCTCNNFAAQLLLALLLACNAVGSNPPFFYLTC